MNLLPIQTHEIKYRQQSLITEITKKKADYLIIFNPIDIFYLTRFHFRPSERPIAFIIDINFQTTLFVPLLEEAHAQEYAIVNEVFSYPEYPGIKHPMHYLKEFLTHKYPNKRLAVDSPGYGSDKGYQGEFITTLLEQQDRYISMKGSVESLRMIKSPAEIALIKESAYWGRYAHELLVKYTKLNTTEMEAESRASLETTREMYNKLKGIIPSYGGAHAFYRGQIGPHSAFPHSQNRNALFEKGFNLVSQAVSDIAGYKSELERTMFMQEINKEQILYFNHITEMQHLVFDLLKPGIQASDIEKKIQHYCQEHGLTQYTLHHTGHSMGLLTHEAPFFDLGDHTILQEGMVFSVEPGLYIQKLGAFRHSDTIVITKDGMEILTTYPRDLDSLIIG